MAERNFDERETLACLYTCAIASVDRDIGVIERNECGAGALAAILPDLRAERASYAQALAGLERQKGEARLLATTASPGRPD